jgi:BASS family bile acid:Na+ symporter
MIDRLMNILVSIMLIEMMVTVGLRVTLVDLRGAAKNWRLLLQALLANYICVPAVTMGLLIVFHPADPLVSVGFLILAVCPGAPFGPLCTGIAKGNVIAAVGLMVALAGSSVIAAPLLLHFLLPWMSAGESLEVDAVKLIGTLLVTQLLPLCVGLGVHHYRPRLAEKLREPANLISLVLGVSTIAFIIVVQFQLFAEIKLRAWLGMGILLVASCASGWVMGGPGSDNRRALTLTTALRNVGVGLVIATGNFPGTAAVTATLVYGIFEIVGSLLLAWAWGRSRGKPAAEKAVD